MTEGRPRSKAHLVGRALLALLIGIVAGAGLSAALGDKGADTPVLALFGGAAALVVVLVRARRKARAARDAKSRHPHPSDVAASSRAPRRSK